MDARAETICAANLLGDDIKPIPIPPEESDIGAQRSQFVCRAAPNSASAARHQNMAAREEPFPEYGAIYHLFLTFPVCGVSGSFLGSKPQTLRQIVALNCR